MVNPSPEAPEVSASSEEICEGTGVTLSASGNVFLSWDNGVGNNQEFFPTITQTYIVTAGNPMGCATTASIMVVVNTSAEMPEITASSTEVCAGEGVTLTATGPSNITWEEGVENGVEFFPTSSFTYEVIGVEGNECTSVNSIEISVNSVPNAPQILASEEEICSGTGITPLALVDETLTWDNGTENNVEFFPSESNTYNASSTNAALCASSKSIDITVNQTPDVPTITPFNGSLVSSATAGNQFYLDGTAIDDATNQTLENPGPGSYTVEVISNGCSSISEASVVVSTEEAFLDQARIFPNPMQNMLFIEGAQLGALFQLMDSRGKIVLTSRLDGNNSSIDVSQIASGVYVATISYSNAVRHVKMVKQ